MNFLCDKCGQKYHVADEKLRGREVTRFKCKKCEHTIEVRGPAGASDAPPADATGAVALPPAEEKKPAPAPAPAARPAAPVPGASAPRPAAATGAAAAPLRTPLSTSASATARAPLGSGSTSSAPRPATGASASATAAAPRPTTSTGANPAAGAGLARSLGAGATAAKLGTQPVGSALRSSLVSKPEPSKPSIASALVSSTDAGWYAGVRDVPVGPLTRAELTTKIESGDITPDTLVWREGLDDWRPLRSVEELGDLVRAASQKLSDGLMGSLGRRDRAGTGSNVVPIGQARTTGKTPAEPTGFEDDGEPTRMQSLEDLIERSEAPAAKAKPAADVSSPRPAVREPAKPAAPVAKPAAPPVEEKKPAPVAAPLPTATPAPAVSAPVEEKKPEPKAAAPLAMMMPAATATMSASPLIDAPPPASSSAFAPPAAEPLLAAPAAFASPLAPPPTAAPVAAALPIAEPARPAPAQQGKGMYVMMAGVLCVGVAVGVVVSRRAPPLAPVPVATAAPVVTAAPSVAAVTQTVGREMELQAEPTATPSATASVEPSAEPSAVASATPSATAGRRHGSGGGSGSSRPAAMPTSSLGAALAMADIPGSGPRAPAPAGPPASSLRNPEASEQTQGPTGAARAQQVLSVLNRSNVVNSCWTAAQRRNPAHPAESIVVNVDVSNTGRPNGVRVTGASDPDLATCISSRARAQPYGPGEALGAEARYTLSRNE